VLAIVLAFWVDDIASTVLVAVNKLGSLINGPLLAVFVMGLLTQRVTGRGARIGFAAGFISNLLLWLGAPAVSWLWWNVSGFLVAVVIGVLSSRREAGWGAAFDTVWTPAFFVGQGFERSWAFGYVTLAGAACGFLLVLGVLGVR
jgi:SSS family solute:Na+ symporter